VTFTHDIKVRYGEVDLQGVVFNAHYLAYVDDCIDSWFRGLGVLGLDSGWDMMVKKATVEWIDSAGLNDVLTLSPRVSRWGRTSFDVTVDGAVGDRHVFVAEVLYVGVRAGTKDPVPTPPAVRDALS
jgi:acyl-CoA thioester hydrolase